MRDIKFRAKRSDDGAWVYGDLTHVQKICSVEEKNKTGKSTMPVVRVAGYDVDEETVGQFTGLLDKNGKEIYECDIVKQEYIDDDTDIATIVWNNGSAEFLLKNVGKNCYWLINGVEIEIIGNIYDNAELLN